jgi:hypothetical protein
MKDVKTDMNFLFLENASNGLKGKLTVSDMEEVVLLMVNAYFVGEDSRQDVSQVTIKGFVND